MRSAEREVTATAWSFREDFPCSLATAVLSFLLVESAFSQAKFSAARVLPPVT